MKADKEIQDIYKKSCQSDLDHYAELCALGIDHDSAGYATPQGLRNVLIISATRCYNLDIPTSSFLQR